MKTINTRITRITPRQEWDSLNRYLQDIARYKVLTLEEEVDLFKKLQILNPDQKEIDDLDKETKIKFLEIRSKFEVCGISCQGIQTIQHTNTRVNKRMKYLIVKSNK